MSKNWLVPNALNLKFGHGFSENRAMGFTTVSKGGRVEAEMKPWRSGTKCNNARCHGSTSRMGQKGVTESFWKPTIGVGNDTNSLVLILRHDFFSRGVMGFLACRYSLLSKFLFKDKKLSRSGQYYP